MAIWQFECYIVPKKNIVENSVIKGEEILSWRKQNSSIETIDFLEKKKSWSDKISQYGKEDETCIEFFYENEVLEEIRCRLDLRSLSKKMLQQILEYIERNEGMILYDNKIYASNMAEIVEVMKNSPANKFCLNPQKYFEELREDNLNA